MGNTENPQSFLINVTTVFTLSPKMKLLPLNEFK